ncbi:MAG: amino acid adenylation domain-containing protein, partial [Pseudonocardiaceae bacterium]
MVLHAGRVLVSEGGTSQPRTRQSERLDHLFEERCDWIREHGPPDHLAVDADGLTLSFDELDARANQLARYLLARGARAGDRIGLLFDQPVQSYLGMLAVLKINAAYLPLDVGFPAERLCYIVADARARMVLSLATVRERVGGLTELGAELVWIDEAAELIASHESSRLTSTEHGDPVDDLAYIIYTSGSTGRPKGVAITHPSICNFVRVAAEIYGIRLQDRVYQGMTIAFDFSVEEIWVPWMAGATLVPKPAGASLLGQELHEFLSERRVTALCCVPTLLATIEEDLPALRFLLVSGEACPQDLITRWHQPARRFLNVYGPTETTVTATWTALHPDRSVTIGIPLPTYAVVILDPEDPFRALPPGEIGEIGIAGIGLAAGYVNRADLTEKVFLPDFLGIPGNQSGRIYRSGDLGRINRDGEIEYHGRIDLQVKIRGYRVELTEIESVLLQLPGIAAAVVHTYCPQPGTVELIGYYSARGDTAPIDPEMILSELRERLPAYMVPACLEQLAVIPLTTSGKVDRKRLPPPRTRRGPAPGHHDAPATATERLLAEVLAQLLQRDQVPVTSHFFDELGASSLVMTRFSAQVRKQANLPPISIRDIYQHPSVRALASLLDAAAPATQTVSPDRADASAVSASGQRSNTVGHLATGAAQLLVFLAFALLGGLLLDQGFRWVSAGTSVGEIYQRAAIFSSATFAGFCALPVVVKWVLIGRWKPTEIRLWSPAYLRFWVVKVLIRASPMALFTGSPLYILYLRALGAKIGRGVSIFSSTIPVATDLITIRDGTMIRRDAAFTGYRAVTGQLHTGRITLGADVLVGERAVLDIDTSMGDRSQLGHSSALHTGQSVPPGQTWHGSPAQPSGVTYRTVPPARCGPARRVAYSLFQLVARLVLGTAAATVLV